jgi:hypothetical protein
MTSRRNAVLKLNSRMLMRDTIGTTSGFDSSIDQSLPTFVSMVPVGTLITERPTGPVDYPQESIDCLLGYN